MILNLIDDNIKEALNLITKDESKDYEKALNLIGNVIEDDLSKLEEALIHYIRGTIYYRRKQLKRALTEVNLALKKDATFGGNKFQTISAWLLVAYIYEDSGKFKESVIQFQKTIEALKTYFEFDEIKELIAEAYLEFAAYYARNLRSKNSEENMLLNLQKAIENNPKIPEAYYFLALFYYDNSLYYRAIENFDHFLDLVPYDDPYYKDMIETAQKDMKELGKIFD